MANCNIVQYDQGGEALTVMFQLMCTNTPIGTIISLTSNNPDGVNPPINIPDTTVTNPSFIVGVQCDVSANYTAELSSCYTLPAGVQPPPGFSITVQASVAVGTLTAK